MLFIFSTTPLFCTSSNSVKIKFYRELWYKKKRVETGVEKKPLKYIIKGARYLYANQLYNFQRF